MGIPLGIKVTITDITYMVNMVTGNMVMVIKVRIIIQDKEQEKLSTPIILLHIDQVVYEINFKI